MKMKAAILRAYQQPLSIEEVDIDPPKADEVLVKIAAAGICHSDYHLMKGEWQSGVPQILGHEASGIVAEVGPGVTGLKPGDRCALSFRAWCGRCRYCIAGRPILCNGYDGGPRGSMLDGTYRVHKDGEDIPVMGRMGGFAEYAVMPAQQLVPITANVDMDTLALIGCAVTTGVGAVLNTAQVEEGATVLVMGLGGIGISIVQGARLANAARIIVSDPIAARRDYAANFGATDILDPKQDDVVAKAIELTGGIGVDYAFDGAGVSELISQGINACRIGGTTVMVGAAMQPLTLPLPAIFLTQQKKLMGCLLGSCNGHRDIPRFLALWRKGALDWGN